MRCGRGQDGLWRWGLVGLLLATAALAGLQFLLGAGDSATAPELALTEFVGSLGGLLGLQIGAPWRQPAACKLLLLAAALGTLAGPGDRKTPS